MPKPLRRILVVEDNPGDVLLIGEALRAKGIQSDIEHRETMEAAVRTVSSYRLGAADVPDLILLDYNLPGGTAREVLAAIQENPALVSVKKAVLTCSVAPKDREQALTAGADAFVYKPTGLDAFLNDVGSAILSLLDGSRACESE